jgi:hypothetical protein
VFYFKESCGKVLWKHQAAAEMEIIGDHITECVRDAYLAEFQDDHAIDDGELTFLRTSLVDSCASIAIHPTIYLATRFPLCPR